jgi:hypothetical protein
VEYSRFPLADVRAAAVPGRVRLSKTRAFQPLVMLLRSAQRCEEFAIAVAHSLKESELAQTTLLAGGVAFDVYGHSLVNEVATRFGLAERRTWYVKLTLPESGPVAGIFFVSLHRLEFPLRCCGKLLNPSW